MAGIVYQALGEGGEDLDVVAEVGSDEEESTVDYLGMATAALNALAAGGAARNAPLAWRVRAPLLDANGWVCQSVITQEARVHNACR